MRHAVPSMQRVHADHPFRLPAGMKIDVDNRARGIGPLTSSIIRLFTRRYAVRAESLR